VGALAGTGGVESGFTSILGFMLIIRLGITVDSEALPADRHHNP